MSTDKVDSEGGETQSDLVSPVHDEELVRVLKALEDPALLATIKAALKGRPAVCQPLVDWLVPDRAHESIRSLLERRLHGKIKSFDAARGYGFIDCPEARAVFDTDVFLHHQQRQNLGVQQEVSFNIRLSKERKPQAFDLRPASDGEDTLKTGVGHGGYEGSAGGSGQNGGEANCNGGGHGGRGGRQPDASEDGAALATELRRDAASFSSANVPGIAERRYEGVLKRFQEHNYGFIECPELKSRYGYDVYVQAMQMCGNFRVGEVLTFNLFVTLDGKPQVLHVCGRAAAPPEGKQHSAISGGGGSGSGSGGSSKGDTKDFRCG